MFSHFLALLTKHFILARRNCCFTICELIAPIIAIALVLSFRDIVEVITVPKTTQQPIYDTVFNVTGSHNTYDSMSVASWLNFNQLTNSTGPVVCSDSGSTQNQHIDHDEQATHHANMVTANYFNNLNQSATFTTKAPFSFPTLPDPLVCSATEFFLDTPTDADVQTISFNQQSFIFDALTNQECFGFDSELGSDELIERKGLIGLVGDFPSDATANTPGHFWDTFKNDFLYDVVPSEFRTRVKYYSDIEDVISENYSTKGNEIGAETMCLIIHFKQADPANFNYDQDIMLKHNSTAPTQFHKNNFPGQDPGWSLYITSGYSSIQTYVNEFIINQNVSAANQMPLSFTFTPMSTQQQKNDPLLLFSILLFFLLGIANCPTVVSITSTLVKDKEFKQREGMSMMGMSALTYYTSYFVQRFVQTIIQSIVMSYLMNAQVQVNSSQLTIFLVFLELNLATMTFSFMLSSLFDSSRNAAIVGTLIQFGSIFFVQTQDFVVRKGWEVMIGCFFPVVSIQFATIGIFSLETGGNGLQLDSVTTPISPQTMLDVYIGSYASILVHLILLVQFEYAIPSEQGINQGWFFMFRKEFWINEFFNESPEPHGTEETDGEEKVQEINSTSIDIANKEDNIFENYEELSEKYKQLDKEGRLLSITNLRKKFGEKLIAVNNVNLKMQEGEIFALLGHNGAGKTTTISMLTGLLMPDSGTGNFHNVDLFGHMKQIRTTLGVCPQLDVLFEDMTVKEHLEMYQTYKDPSHNFLIKDGTDFDKEEEVNKWLDKLQLREHEDELIQQLSGGTKRRLSVAIALIADSKLVLLDEPSSGMDLTSKQKLWDILKEIKKDRVIILTTHYMDEADQLGDRIAIMGEGQIRCCGSNLFLKSRFGGGYKLTIEFEEPITSKQDEFIAELNKTCAMKVMESSEIRIDIKCNKEDNPNFTEMFGFLERSRAKQAIANQAFGDSNLEDVFLAVSKLNTHHNEDNDIAFDVEIQRVTGVMRWFQHFMALLIKRFRYSTRDFYGITCEVILPILCVFIGLVLKDLASQFSSQGPLAFDPDQMLVDEIQGIPTFLPKNLEIYSQDYTGVSTSRVDGTVANAILDEFGNKYSSLNRKNVPGTYTDPVYQVDSLNNLQDIDTEMYSKLVNNQNTEKEPEIAVTMQETETAQSFLGHINSRYFHIVPMTIHWTSNALFKQVSGSNSANISHRNRPIPFTEAETVANNSGDYFLYSFFTIIGWALVPTAAIVFIVKERESLSKQQQQVSGVDLFSYWASSLLFDMSKFLITVTVSLLILWLRGVDDLFQVNHGQFQVQLLSKMTFAFASFMMVYATSFLFNSLLRAMVASLTFYMATGIVGYIAQNILSALSGIFENLVFWEKFVDITMSLLNPVQANNRVFNEVVLINTLNKFNFQYDAWNQDKVGKYLVYECYTAGASFLIILAIELYTSNIITAFNTPKDKDESITTPSDEANAAISVINASKTQKDIWGNEHLAVKDISFEAKQKSCQVILGTNGAGKSTLFKGMTGEIALSSGDSTVDGQSISNEQSAARERIGQCPQDNSIIDLLTASEHLYFQGRLKFIAEDSLRNAVELLLDMMNLRMNNDNLAGRFSGGNKRKLMVACSLIGGPKAILLDEPSTGMDPEAKRFMWNSIKKFKADSGVVLTTHSMDEAEALADQLAIMKGGEFKFTGTLADLRHTFSKGLQVDLMLKVTEKEVAELQEKLELDKHELHLQDMKLIISRMFEDRFTWEELTVFGNGHILVEQLQDPHTHKVSETKNVDQALFLEQLVVLREIIAIVDVLNASFPKCQLDMENIGHLLRFNIQQNEGENNGKLNCGSLFKVLDSQEDELCIDYQSIANSKMETILREFIEDDSQNSNNTCNVLNKPKDDTVKKAGIE